MKTNNSICERGTLCQAEIQYKYLGFAKASRKKLQMPPNGTTINIIDGHTSNIQQTVIVNHTEQEGRINSVDFLKKYDLSAQDDLLIEYIPNNPIYTLKLTKI